MLERVIGHASSKRIYTPSDLDGLPKQAATAAMVGREASTRQRSVINPAPSVADTVEDQDLRRASCSLDSDVR